MQDADLALVAARSSDGLRVRLCTETLRAHQRRRLQVEQALSSPYLLDQLELHYQPVVDLATEQPTGVEALIRWAHPDLGPIPPGEFMPLAERTGAIAHIGCWVLDTALQQLADWDEQGLPPLSMAVNVSARQLRDPTLPRTVAAALHRSGLDPSRVCLEVTETALVDESEVTTRVLQSLLAQGLRIHVDDFGTGYSSFDQLWRFTVHGLKIDRSYTAQLGQSDTADTVIAGILSIAATIGLDVVAEGVEQADQRDQLKAMGCQLGQGFLWSPAVPPDSIPALMTQHTAAAVG